MVTVHFLFVVFALGTEISYDYEWYRTAEDCQRQTERVHKKLDKKAIPQESRAVFCAPLLVTRPS